MNSLQARVCAANQANTIANELLPKLVEAMRPFIGKKIVTQQNELTAAVKKAVESFDLGKRGVYLDGYKSYTLRWVVKTCVSSDSQHANYWESSMRIGRIENHILVNVDDDIQPLKTDYSANHIAADRNAYKRAQDAADQLKYALSPFGEYDR